MVENTPGPRCARCGERIDWSKPHFCRGFVKLPPPKPPEDKK